MGELLEFGKAALETCIWAGGTTVVGFGLYAGMRALHLLGDAPSRTADADRN